MGATNSKGRSRTPLEIVKEKEGNHAVKGMDKVFKRAGFPKEGVLDSEKWKDFRRKHSEWVAKHELGDKVFIWFTLSEKLESEARQEKDLDDQERGYFPGLPPPHYNHIVVQDQATGGSSGTNAPTTLHSVLTTAPSAPPAPDTQTVRSKITPVHTFSAPIALMRPTGLVEKEGTSPPERECNFCNHCVTRGHWYCWNCNNQVNEKQDVCKELTVDICQPGTTKYKALLRIQNNLGDYNNPGLQERSVEVLDYEPCEVAKPSLFIAPVRTHTYPNPVFQREVAEGPTNSRLVSADVYTPFSRYELQGICQEMPDPYKKPAAFASYMKMIQMVWTPSWMDIYIIVKTKLTQGDVALLSSYTADAPTGPGCEAIRDVPTPAERKSRVSGENMLARIQKWAWDQKKKCPSMETVIQRSDPVRTYFDKVTASLVDEGLAVTEEMGERMLKSKFLEGLDPKLREYLYACKPECRSLPLEQILTVLEGIEDREKERKEKTRAKPLQIHVVQGTDGNWKQGDSQRGKGGRPKFQSPNTGKCFFCNLPGHIKKDCPKYKIWLEKKEKQADSESA